MRAKGTRKMRSLLVLLPSVFFNILLLVPPPSECLVQQQLHADGSRSISSGIIKRKCVRSSCRCCGTKRHLKYDDDDDDDDMHDDPQLPGTIPKFYSFGLSNRSSPSQRKAMGKSSASSATIHVCQNCGAEYIKWVGQCLTCKEWNTIQEMQVTRSTSTSSNPFSSRSLLEDNRYEGHNINGNGSKQKSSSWLGASSLNGRGNNNDGRPIRLNDIYEKMKATGKNKQTANVYNSDINGHNLEFFSLQEKRLVVPNNHELNNVLGGGIMPGSLTLLGGDPGVGKSTLAIQLAASVASLCKPPKGIGMGTDDNDDDVVGPAIYVSGEENSWQIASRAARLGIQETELLLMCDTDADFVANMIAGSSSSSSSDNRRPSLVVIDSIQTMLCEAGGASAPGGVTQVRETVGLFLRLAKATGIPIIMIGHVTKSGDVAGPKTVEHMVDTVLYLEGDRSSGSGSNVRILRASKNRFGSADEVGMYQISGVGARGGALIPISDPSSFFLSTRMDEADVEGCAVSLVLEGSRCLAAEVQALVTRTSDFSSSGRRTVDGVAMSRVLLILAVLEKRYGIRFSRQDVYVNVVGGMKLSAGYQKGDRSGSDLAVAIALVSSLAAIPIRSDTAFVGEMGLVGELRSVPSIEKRINEAKRMGFSRVVAPKIHRKKGAFKKGSLMSSATSSRTIVEGIEVIECDNALDAINAGLLTKISPQRPKARKGQGVKGKENQWLSEDDLLITDEETDDDIGKWR